MHFYAFEMYDRVYLNKQNGSKEAKVEVVRTRGNRNEFVLIKPASWHHKNEIYSPKDASLENKDTRKHFCVVTLLHNKCSKTDIVQR